MTNAQLAERFVVVFDGSLRPVGEPLPVWVPAHQEPEVHQGVRTEESWREDDALLSILRVPKTRAELREATGFSHARVNRVLQRLERAKRIHTERHPQLPAVYRRAG